MSDVCHGGRVALCHHSPALGVTLLRRLGQGWMDATHLWLPRGPFLLSRAGVETLTPR